MAIKIKHEQFDMLGDLTKQQQAAIRCDNRRVLVLAGAGSGKTRTLLQKIVYLIREKKVKPDEIMAITFTKNATHEMIDRLLLASDNTREYAQAIRSKHVTVKQANELRRAKMREHKWIARLTLRTFHGLCYKLMRNYGAKEFDNRF
ncbi:MAG: UvrD-helicase domain-containing protein, partial [Saprospiraceae bacterium]|nr:UvrD-helicase domain-containing protein [Saprospiraceae bacterium]